VNSKLLAELRALAHVQLGLFTSEQGRQRAASIGEALSPRATEHAVERGWIRRVRRDVFAFVGYPPSRWEPILAAALSVGPKAVISHTAAAAIHGFWGVAIPNPELTVIGTGGRRLIGTTIHHSGDELPTCDVQPWHGAKITTPIRTLVDIVPSFSDYLVGKIIDEGTIGKLWTPEGIDRRITTLDRTGRPSLQRLQGLVQPRLAEGDPDSVLEQRVIRVLKGKVPDFKIHYVVVLEGRTIEMDIAWPEYLIDGEADGRAVRKGSRSKFDGDRLRSNLLDRLGWRQVHFTSTMDDRTILAQVVPLFPREVIPRDVWNDIVGP
jgi:hypothetical protein